VTRRAILHIGAEKTGTTALQLAFRRDADRLAGFGVRYPDFLVPAHGALVYAAADKEASVRDMAPHIGLMPGETRAAFTARLHQRLAREVAAHPHATFVLSTEHAQSRLDSVESVDQVRTFLADYFDEIDIAVYLRRWDRMALSYHATAARNGASAPFTFRRYVQTTLLDYPRLLDRWAQVFGDDRIHVGIFDRAEMVNGSILDDFTQRFGLPALNPVGDQNVSLDTGGLALLRLLDRALEGEHAENQALVREAVVAAIRPDPTAALPVSRAEAAQFVADFARDEAAILDRWFPGREALFDDRYDEYPQVPEPVGRNWRDLSNVLVDAVLAGARREKIERAESRYYRALAHRRGARLELAEAEIREALALLPGNGAFWYVLADILNRQADVAGAHQAIGRALAIEPDNADFRAFAAMIGV
jgi:hypothetical protein